LGVAVVVLLDAVFLKVPLVVLGPSPMEKSASSLLSSSSSEAVTVALAALVDAFGRAVETLREEKLVGTATPFEHASDLPGKPH
jgi:hypothetical protein